MTDQRTALVLPCASAPLIWGAALLSGAAALSYEVLWSRALVVPLGNSTDAAAIVLAGFMLGIAVGAWLGGGLAERSRSPLRLYALIELALALYAVIMPSMITALVNIPAAEARYVAALCFIALPSLAMGVTLPLLVHALSGHGDDVRREVGMVYGANTLGAASGAAWTGFFGLAAFGVARCSGVAAGASLAAAAIAFLVAARWTSPVQPRSANFESSSGTPARSLLPLGAAFLGGFVMLASEMLWARLLTFVFGHDTYAFASLLVIVLVSLGLGGILHRALSRLDQEKLLGLSLLLLGPCLLSCFWFAAHLVAARGRDPFGLEASGELATSLELELYRALAYTPILALLPAIVSGVLFAAACSVYARGAANAGRRVGAVLLANGIGSALGALTVAAGLVAWLGVQGSFVLLALLSATAASLVYFGLARRPSAVWTAAAPLVVVGGLALLLPPMLPRQMLLRVVGERHQRLLHYEEARTGTVSVIENAINGERQLLMNAVNEVTTRLVHDQSFKVLGHLGPLLHPAPRSAVMVCLGAGISAGAALTHDLERLDVVDLSAAVARGARYFANENNGVLDDPRLRLHIEDGRQYLLNSPGGYDVAIVDSTHPKSVDSWILYTKEFYELVRARLSDGGILVQWLPLHGLSEREVKIVLRTFLHVFPEMTLWANVGYETYGQVAYAKLVGVKGKPLHIDPELMRRRLEEPSIRSDLAGYGMASLEELLDLYIAGPEAVDRFTHGLRVQTDDHPIVVFTTEYSRGRRFEPPLLLAARAFAQPLSSVLPLSQPLRPDERKRVDAALEAQGLVTAGQLARASELRQEGTKLRLFQGQAQTTRTYYLALAERYPDDPERLFEAATQLSTLGHGAAARGVFERALALEPRSLPLTLNYALLLGALGERKRSLELLAALQRRHPRSSLVLRNLAAAALADNDPGLAAKHLVQALQWDATDQGARTELARSRLLLGELERALADVQAVLRDSPWEREAHVLAGRIMVEQGDLGRAERHFRTALAFDSTCAETWHRLGTVLEASGSVEPSAAAYEQALRMEPNRAVSLDALGRLETSRGRHEHALELHVRALEADPTLARAAYHLGESLLALGRTGDAGEAFCLALRLEPRHAQARKSAAASNADCTSAPPPR